MKAQNVSHGIPKEIALQLCNEIREQYRGNWVFIKRGYESAVLAHTLSDWITVLLFT